MSPVLKVDPGERSEERELDFEITWQKSLTTAQRFEMMERKSREMLEALIRNGHRKPAEIVKRT